MVLTPADRARGAYQTPPSLARVLAEFALRDPADRLLDPGCGDGALLAAAVARMRALGAAGLLDDRLHGVEIDAEAARRAALLDARITLGDFLDLALGPPVDAVIGNPPFLGYHRFRRSVPGLSGFASAWAAFTLRALDWLKPCGRLALVLPAELMAAGYAAPLRRRLLDRFGRIRLVTFTTRAMPQAMADVLLLLAEGQGGTAGVEVIARRDADDLADLDAGPVRRPAADRWRDAALAEEAVTILDRLAASGAFVPLSQWGRVALGAVTGDNGFFCLDDASATALRPDERLPILPPGRMALPGALIDGAAWAGWRVAGRPVWLFRPQGDPSAAAAAHLAAGMAAGVDRGFKCRGRRPWWRVPLAPVPPDLVLAQIVHDRPRLLANPAGIHPLNAHYGVTLAPGTDAAALAEAAQGCVTQLSAERLGVAYGGGLLKLPLRVAPALLVPSPTLTVEAGDDRRLAAAGLDRADIAVLAAARDDAFARRTARARGPRR
jgi:adenine-specific DNA-methyltransferase